MIKLYRINCDAMAIRILKKYFDVLNTQKIQKMFRQKELKEVKLLQKHRLFIS